MPTRPIQNHSFSFGSIAKRRQLRALIAGLSAGLLIGAAHDAAADGAMQLRPPLNSKLTIRSADTSWTARATDKPTPQAAAITPPVAASKSAPGAATSPDKVASSIPSDDQPLAGVAQGGDAASVAPAPQSGKKSLQAIPASGPLDRFRGPLAKLPSGKTDTPTSTPQLGEPSVPTPGDQVLDRLATPSLPSGGAWQGRTVGQKSGSYPSTASPRETVQEPDGFRRPVTEGNWIARDAINRIAPLEDPVARTQRQLQRQPVATQSPAQLQTPAQTRPAPTSTQPVGPRSSAGSAPVATNSNAASASKTNVTPNVVERQAKPVAQTDPPTKSADGFINRSRSMSLGEAKTAVQSPEQTRTDTPTRTQQASPLVLEQPEPNDSTDAAAGLSSQPRVESQKLEKLPQTTLETAPGSTNKAEAAAKAAEQKATQSKPPKQNSAEMLPKRKPLTNIVDAELSSTKREVAKPLQRLPDDERSATQLPPANESANASVGDLSPSENQVLDYTGQPASEIRPTRTVASLRGGIERTLRYFYARPEVASGRSNWGMMHSLMVFGADTQLIVGREKYNAIAWIAGNNNCRGQRLLTHDANGIQAKSGVGLQGHQGQFLAVMGMCNVPTSYPLHAGKVKYDVAALIEAEKKACKAGEELTFTLIGLAHYLDTDSSWIADDGTEWDFERLIAEELKQPIVGAACGGTHRLMGYTHALRKRRAEGKPITGHWKRAETYTEDFIKYAYSLQNRDGSMSTDWFEGRADDGKVDRKIQTTGHIVEWLLTVTPDDQLQDRRLVAAVSFLLRSVGNDLDHDWSIGPKGHALRSLAMYHQRVFRAGTPWIPTSMARSGQTQRR